MSGAGHGARVRVFISYSTTDADLVQRLKDSLARAGVDVWLDHEQLTPGAPNWQRAIRDGIAQASHVIYVASETAAESSYVYDEISLARGKGKPVIPFWARGTEWHDCIPLGWGLTQYVDGRGASFDAGFSMLLASLGITVVAPSPSAHGDEPNLTPAARHRALVHPLPDLPQHLSSLGFRGVNQNGTPAIVPPLITVPAGPFLMGSVKAKDGQAYEDETPQHRVDLGDFQIAKFPVTVAEYELAVRLGAVIEPPEFLGVTWAKQQLCPDHPVVCISWQDATAYIAWLVRATSQRGWRLPSEAEWEKAARWDAARGVSRIYPWGNTFHSNRCDTSESGFWATNPVGSYPASVARRSGASPYGVEDMAGNVWEWTSSLYKPYPYTVSDSREGPNPNDSVSLRGGSWSDDASRARTAYRSSDKWGGRDVNLGFRLALSSEVGSS
ncbi:MAG TPA: SUMF1/EgtB/PvdO family nonheme iron enzyme [Ktedonobacterales bacterium]